MVAAPRKADRGGHLRSANVGVSGYQQLHMGIRRHTRVYAAVPGVDRRAVISLDARKAFLNNR